MELTPKTVNIDEDGRPNVVSMDQATVSPKAKETPIEDNKMRPDDNEAEREAMHAWDTRIEKENLANETRIRHASPIASCSRR